MWASVISFLYFLVSVGITGSNLVVDERFSTILSHGRDAGSQFGLSISLADGARSKWIIIGEPRGNSSFNAASHEPGKIWSCNYRVGGMECDSIEVDSVTNNNLGKSMLGSALEATSNGVLACAPHLMEENRSAVRISGACYDLRVDSKGLLPPVATIAPNNYLNGDKMAAFGLSSRKISENSVLVGAPAFSHGFGAVAIVQLGSSSGIAGWNYVDEGPDSYFGYAVTSGTFFPDQLTYHVGGLPRQNNLRGKVILFPSDQCQGSTATGGGGKCKLENYQSLNGYDTGSYFGSVLFAQDIDNDGLDELFVGAPYSCSRANKPGNMGRPRDNGCVYVYKFSQNVLKMVQVLTGSGAPYARFGTAISSMGKLDTAPVIVIGAPYEDQNRGAVYFYGGKDILTNNYFKRISGRDPIFSALRQQLHGLGYSFSRTQDMDESGTPDIAVGSYISNQALLLRSRHTLALPPTEVLVKDEQEENHRLGNSSSFGLKALSSSSFTLVIRTWLHLKDKSIHDFHSILGEHIVLWTRLSVDADFRRFKITMVNPGGSWTSIDDQTLVFQSPRITTTNFANSRNANGMGYVSTQVSVQRIREIDETEAVILPIKITAQSWFNESLSLQSDVVSYDVQQQGPSTREDSFRPYLPAPATNEVRTYSLPITNDCKVPGYCLANVGIQRVQFLIVKDGHFVGLERLPIGSVSEVFLRWVLTNSESDKADAPATYLTFDSPDVQIELESNYCIRDSTRVGQRFWCNQTGSLPPNNKKTIRTGVKLKIRAKYATKSSFSPLTVSMQTSYAGSTKLSNPRDLSLGFYIDSRVTLKGFNLEVSTEETPKIIYEVSVSGTSPVNKVTLDLWIPFKSETNTDPALGIISKELISIQGGYQRHYCQSSRPFLDSREATTTQQPLPSSTPSPTTPTDETNTESPNTESPYTDNGRRKRSLNSSENNKNNKGNKSPHNNTLVLSCDQEDPARCISVQCTFEDVEAETSFRLELPHRILEGGFSILNGTWNSWLIQSKAQIQILDGSQDSFRSSNMSEVRIIKHRYQPTAPPIWIYIISVLGGLLVLIVMFVTLYKCGFFKRDLKEKLDSMKSGETEGAGVEATNVMLEARESCESPDTVSKDCLLDDT